MKESFQSPILIKEREIIQCLLNENYNVLINIICRRVVSLSYKFFIFLFSIRDSIGFSLTNRLESDSPLVFLLFLLFLLRPNIKIIRSLLPVYICTPTNSFRNNFIITDRCIKFASICYWMMMASAHHTSRHTTDLCALYYIITQSKDR